MTGGGPGGGARRLGRALDRTYHAAAVAAGAAIVAICLLVTAQIVLNGLGRAFPGRVPTTIPSYADVAGYLLAASTFLALAHALRAGAHVRVTLLTRTLPRGRALLAEGCALLLALGVVGTAAWFMGALAAESLRYGDTSSGIVPIPLALPQAVATLGLGLLWLALAQTLAEALAHGAPAATDAGEA